MTLFYFTERKMQSCSKGRPGKVCTGRLPYWGAGYGLSWRTPGCAHGKDGITGSVRLDGHWGTGSCSGRSPQPDYHANPTSLQLDLHIVLVCYIWSVCSTKLGELWSADKYYFWSWTVLTSEIFVVRSISIKSSVTDSPEAAQV